MSFAGLCGVAAAASMHSLRARVGFKETAARLLCSALKSSMYLLLLRTYLSWCLQEVYLLDRVGGACG